MKRILIQFLFPPIILLLLTISITAQTTRIRGLITDAQTKQPLPFVAIALKGTSIGTITNFDGKYNIETRSSKDTLKITCMGYRTQYLKIKRNAFQNLDIEMEPNEFTLKEVVVVPGENPAHRILRKINENKDKNSPNQYEAYEYELYNKMEIDVNNIDARYKSKKIFKHFQFVFNYIDTSAESGKNFLPMFISETMSDYYYRKSPSLEKEVIKANKISGWEDVTIQQFTGDMYLKKNYYDNYINIFGKQFVSPAASFGTTFYKYYLTDSAFIDNQWCYHISFKPRRKQELTFTGDFWINDSTFAIKKMKVKIADDANINYIRDLVENIEYEKVDNKHWFVKKNDLFVDFNIADSTIGFFARKTSIYKNIKINKPQPDKFYNDLGYDRTKILEDASQKPDSFWALSRPDSLTIREKNIYKMIDTIREVPMFKTYVDVVNLIVSGYKPFNKIEVGPYPKLYSYNNVEGNRFRIGGRTTPKFSNQNFWEAYIAYGTRDKSFKYGISFHQYLNKKKSARWGIGYQDDLEQLGKDPNSLITTDNILGTLFSRDGQSNMKLNRVRELNLFYENEWITGFSNNFMVRHRTIFNDKNDDDITIFNRLPLPKIETVELTVKTRFAYKEQFIVGARKRTSIGTDYPVIQLSYTIGNYRQQVDSLNRKNILDGYYYHKLALLITDKVYLNPIGFSRYELKAGKTFGHLPLQLLELHEGNETYWYNNAFNLMNYYEFVSDQYVSLRITHHFEGMFLNKIPLFRKLMWRELVFVNGVIGSLSDENKKVLSDNKITNRTPHYLTKPYWETGVGVENILKILRIDAVWRMSYLDHENVSKFGIRAKLQLVF